MADQENSGRNLVLKKNSVAIAGIRNATIDWSGDSIDISNNDTAGKRKLLGDLAQEQITISGDGIELEDIFRAVCLASGSKMLTDISVDLPIVESTNTTKGTITGSFLVTAFSLGAPYNDAVTFNVTMESSGAWTYTPEAA